MTGPARAFTATHTAKAMTRPMPAQPTLWLLTEDADARASYARLTNADTLPEADALYYAEIVRYPVLSRKEEQRLAVAMRAGDARAKEHLFHCNLRLAWSIATWYASARAPRLDLAQVANISLWKHMDGFDPSRNHKFSTFITWYLIRDVRRAADELANLIRRPVYMLARERRLYRLADQMEAEAGHAPSDELVAAALDLPLEQAKRAARDVAVTRPRVLSLEALSTTARRHGESEPEADYVLARYASASGTEASAEEETMAGDAARAELTSEMASVLARVLSAREREVVALRFGQEWSLDKIGQHLGLTRERVRQIESKVLEKLRKEDRRSGAFSRLAEDYATE